MLFQPTHVLVSRTRETPVQLIPTQRGYALYTQSEWEKGRQPAFELRAKLGIFCLNTPVIGYNLQPLAPNSVVADASTKTVSQ